MNLQYSKCHNETMNTYEGRSTDVFSMWLLFSNKRDTSMGSVIHSVTPQELTIWNNSNYNVAEDWYSNFQKQ